MMPSSIHRFSFPLYFRTVCGMLAEVDILSLCFVGSRKDTEKAPKRAPGGGASSKSSSAPFLLWDAPGTKNGGLGKARGKKHLEHLNPSQPKIVGPNLS